MTHIEPGFTGADFQYPEFGSEEQVKAINEKVMLRAVDIAVAVHFMLTQPRRTAGSLIRVETRRRHPRAIWPSTGWSLLPMILICRARRSPDRKIRFRWGPDIKVVNVEPSTSLDLVANRIGETIEEGAALNLSADLLMFMSGYSPGEFVYSAGISRN